MTVAGKEQRSALALLCELTVLSPRGACWASSHGGGRAPCPGPALSSVFALCMHLKRVKRRKKGCSPRNGRSCRVPPGRPRGGLATCRAKKAKLQFDGLMAMAILGLNLRLFPPVSRKALFSPEEAPPGPVLGPVADDVQALCYCGTQAPQETSAAEFQDAAPSDAFGAGAAGQGGLC